MSCNFAGYWHNPITQLLDFSSPLLVGFNCVRVLLRDRQKEENGEIVKILDDAFWLLQAVASLTIWLKCITFLQVWPKTSYLIRMIYFCLADIIPFGLVLLFSIVGFADAFFCVSKTYIGNDKIIEDLAALEFEAAEAVTGTRGIPNLNEIRSEILGKTIYGTFNLADPISAIKYVYLVSLGEFNDSPDEFDSYGWILFIIITVFNLILLLNLLIAIISSVYEELSAEKDKNYYKSLTKIV